MTTTLLTPDQVAEVLGIRVSTVMEKYRRGEIPGVKIGRFWRTPPSELDRWISRRR